MVDSDKSDEWDKNVSPVGWYVGSYLLRFVELNAPKNDDPDSRFISWENTVLVQATDIESAYDRVTEFAKENSHPYKAGPKGVDAQWLFEGVTEVLPVYEDIQDGCEIMWAHHKPRKLKTLRKWLKSREKVRQK